LHSSIRHWLLGPSKASFKFLPNKGQLHLYETEHGNWQGSVPVADITRAWFTPNGKTLIVYSPDLAPTLWDLPVRKPWGRLQVAWIILAGCFTAIEVWLHVRRKRRLAGA
jgi:hypothetical protein